MTGHYLLHHKCTSNYGTEYFLRVVEHEDPTLLVGVVATRLPYSYLMLPPHTEWHTLKKEVDIMLFSSHYQRGSSADTVD